MVRDSHLKGEDSLVESYIESYAKSGCSRIGIHINSVSNLDQVYKCFDQIRLNGSDPGLVLEVDEPFNSKLREVILEQNISWIVVMGVRVGFGGQLFNTAALQKIQSIRNFSNEFKKNILIEIDGGLSFDNLYACLLAGANNFAGWSIIKSDIQFTMREKLERVNILLSGNFSSHKNS
jgi:ribulose-phosphate 3-epimerase